VSNVGFGEPPLLACPTTVRRPKLLPEGDPVRGLVAFRLGRPRIDSLCTHAAIVPARIKPYPAQR
jgi:hypothetical protein